MVAAVGTPFIGMTLNTAPLQIVVDWAGITGLGFTEIVNTCGVPEQPLAVGVTVIVPTMGALVVLVVVKMAMLPAPLAAKPIPVLLLVQLNTVPVTLKTLENVTAAVLMPTQTD